jgi:uncharacterized membrane protein YhaH (DUF805 family)
MNFRDAADSGFRRYVDFNGRSSRSEFWYWILFFYVIWFAVWICLGIGGAIAGGGFAYAVFSDLVYLVFLGTFACPNIAVVVRRLHDTNRSGWWYLLSLTIVGVIPLLIWWCTQGTIGENQYGGDPLSTDHTTVKTDEAWVS